MRWESRLRENTAMNEVCYIVLEMQRRKRGEERMRGIGSFLQVETSSRWPKQASCLGVRARSINMMFGKNQSA